MSKPSENPSGQPIGGQWAKQQKVGVQKQEHDASAGHPQLSDEEQKKLEQEVVDAGDDAPDLDEK